MSDRPIIFSAPMVLSLLAGRKVQTRRALKLPTKGEYVRPDMGGWEASTVGGRGTYLADGSAVQETPCVWNQTTGTVVIPPIKVGDRLWVKEGVTRFDKGSCDQWIWYRAGSNDPSGWIGKRFPGQDPNGEWSATEGPAGGAPYNVSPIYMPRWASRITLHVTEVRVQRLQEISEEDARAEGIVCVGTYHEADSIPSDPLVGYSEEQAWSHDPRDHTPVYELPGSAKGAYRRLWNSINGPGSWDANPWVAAYTFTVEHANIDASRRPTADGFAYTPLGREARNG